MNFVAVDFCNIDDKDLKNAILSELYLFDPEGIEEGENCLSAFFDEKNFEKHERSFREKWPVLFENKQIRIKKIPDKNWNEIWENSYNPVKIGDCYIRADFHAPDENVKYDLIINPKMAFGTAHHETTKLMIEKICRMNLKDRTILDIGTGTGILAIIAEKMNAKKIMAIDNDLHAIESTQENITKNNVRKIEVIHANNLKEFSEEFDIIFANINRNTIIELIPDISRIMSTSGMAVFSGFLDGDQIKINNIAKNYNLLPTDIKTSNQWLAISYEKTKPK